MTAPPQKLAEATFPTSPDALTEEANDEGTTPYGEWDAFTGAFMLDRATKAVGIQSVKTQAYAGSSGSVRLTHWFYKNGQILYPNLGPYSHIHFFIKTAANLDPNAWVLEIIDDAGHHATINLIVASDQWVENFWALENLSVPEGFNWTRIMGIRIYNNTKPVDEDSAFWVDELYFWGQLPSYLIFFDTRYEGEEASLNLPVSVIAPDGTTWTKYTPFSLLLTQENGTQYIIITGETRFVRWENGETEPTRTYTPTSQATLIAYYQPVVTHSLIINSSPEGKQIKIGPYVLTTPVAKCSLHLSPGIYIVEVVDTTNFLRWENGDANPQREIVLEGDLTIEAVFSEGNGGNGDFSWMLIAVPAMIIGGVATYYLWKRFNLTRNLRNLFKRSNLTID